MERDSMTGRLEGKRAIITGAGSGIGRAAAILLAAEGTHVIAADIHASGAETAEHIRSTGGQAWFLQADVSDARQVERLMADAAAQMGGIDILVSNAGRQMIGRVSDFTPEEWDVQMAVNVRSVFLCAKYAQPWLEKSRGVIVNTGSVAGIRGGASGTAYAASKGAIIAFSRALAMELAPLGIRVNCICPGWVDTAFNQPAITMLGGQDSYLSIVAQTVPLKRHGSPEEIAEAVLFLASDASSYMTGQNLVIDGGLV
jgi:NAD(P)-dependent dehydrogenase (short-subunit alcohol dehydrogenase family)